MDRKQARFSCVESQMRYHFKKKCWCGSRPPAGHTCTVQSCPYPAKYLALGLTASLSKGPWVMAEGSASETSTSTTVSSTATYTSTPPEALMLGATAAMQCTEVWGGQGSGKRCNRGSSAADTHLQQGADVAGVAKGEGQDIVSRLARSLSPDLAIGIA